MPIKLKRFFFFITYLIVSVLLIFLQSSGFITLQIGTFSAFFALPCVLFAGFYFGCYTGALMGFLLGILADVYSAPLIFNTVAFTVLGFACGLVMMYLFNRNLAAACVLSAVGSFVYFIAKWLIVYAFVDPVPFFVLWHYTLPSFIYTALFGIVFYFLIRKPFNRFPAELKK